MKKILIAFITIFVAIKATAQKNMTRSPGTLDENFGNQGKYVLFSATGNVNHATVQQDDKILQIGGITVILSMAYCWYVMKRMVNWILNLEIVDLLQQTFLHTIVKWHIKSQHLKTAKYLYWQQ